MQNADCPKLVGKGPSCRCLVFKQDELVLPLMHLPTWLAFFVGLFFFSPPPVDFKAFYFSIS